MDWQAFALSLRLAAVTTAILLAVAVPLAALIVLGRGRCQAAVEAVATLPMACLHRARFLSSRHARPAHRLWPRHRRSAWPSARIFLRWPRCRLRRSQSSFAVQPLVAGRPRSTQPSSMLHASSAQVPCASSRDSHSLASPFASPVLFSAFSIRSASSASSSCLGGDIPGATRTLSIVLYDQVENFDHMPRAALLLLALSAIALIAIYATSQKRGSERCGA